MIKGSNLIIAKKASGLLIMIAFLLPLSHCERSTIRDSSSEVAIEGSMKTDYIVYPYMAIDREEIISSLIIVALYFWPIATLLANRFAKNSTHQKFLTLLEIGLCLFTIYFVIVWSSIGTPQLGALISILGASAYLCAVLLRAFKSGFRHIQN